MSLAFDRREFCTIIYLPLFQSICNISGILLSWQSNNVKQYNGRYFEYHYNEINHQCYYCLPGEKYHDCVSSKKINIEVVIDLSQFL